MPSTPKLRFVAGRRHAAWPDLDGWSERDIDANAARFRSGVDAWIVQTYLRVRDALASEGWSVALAPGFEPGTIAIAHWDELHRLRWLAPRAYLVGVRADRPPLCVADKVVRQNNVVADDGFTFGVAHWPQPGLRVRRVERGDRVRRIGYFGRMAEAAAFLSDAAFLAEVAALGLEFAPSERDWQDYGDVDVVLAFRTAPPTLLRQKPAAKLTNAWLAGVPAIVGPEPAYLQLRRDELDMCVAADARDVIGALSRLAREPGLYAAMRERARSRASEFDVPAVRARWLEFFRARVAPAFAQWQAHSASPLQRYPWYFRRLVEQRLAVRRFRARIRSEQAAMGDHPSAAAAGLMPAEAPTQTPARPPPR